MTEHPILFSAPMIRAILSGRKTQTRRIVKLDDGGCIKRDGKRWHPADPNAALGCPHGQAGDALWVRETFSGPYCMETAIANAAVPPSYWAPGTAIWYWADGNPPSGDWTRPRPSIHMPRWASRITLRIKSVRVERLQDISEDDAVAEGIEGCGDFFGCPCWKCYDEPADDETDDDEEAVYADDPVGSFRSLWNSLNAKRGAGWDTNQFVWVIEFEREEPHD